MPNPMDLGTRRERAILIAIIALIAISPLGHEGTNPIVLLSYRLLLIGIATLAAFEVWRLGEFEVSPSFLGLCGLAIGLMWLSIFLNAGSRFDGLYRWYENVLFGVAFIAMAALHRTRTIGWKTIILWSVIGVDCVYVIVDLVIGQRPLTAPFVNPNYFASFLLVGFSCALAVVLYATDWRTKATAAAAGAFLYYGMGQAWSRGATITGAAVLGLAIIRFVKGRNISAFAMGAASAAALLLGLAASPTLLRKFTDRGQQDPYNYQRPKIWFSALQVIRDHPVLGVGMGQFFHVSKKYTPPIEGTLARYLKRPGIAHSEYLQYVAENGAPAAILLFSLAGYLIVLAVRRSRTCSAEQRPFQEAAILCAASLGIHALVDNNWTVPVMAAGLTAFSLGDVLPMRPWPLHIPAPTQPAKAWPEGPGEGSRRWRTAGVVILLFLFADSTLIPSVGLAFNELGHRAFEAGNLHRAEALHRLAAAIIADHDVVLDNAGMVYFESYLQTRDRRMLELADVFFSRAMAANANSEEPRLHMENVLISRLTGNPAKDRPIHLQIEAIDREVLRIDPFNPFTRMNLAQALHNAGSIDEADQELERAIALEPNYVPGYLEIANWRMSEGHTAESETYREKAAAVVMRYRDAHVVDPYEAMLLGRPLPR